MHSIEKLKDLHYTETIYIICAGSSTTYFEPSFFADKVVIGVNNVFKKFPCNYVIAKDLLEHPRFTRMVEEIKELSIPLVYPEHHTGHHKDPKNNIDYELGYMFEHLDNKSADMNDRYYLLLVQINLWYQGLQSQVLLILRHIWGRLI